MPVFFATSGIPRQFFLAIVATCVLATPAASQEPKPAPAVDGKPTPAEVEAEDATNQQLQTAQQLLLTGKYEEAAAAFRKIEEPAAAVGLARCSTAVGDADKALSILAAAEQKFAEDASLHAEHAGIAFNKGDYPAAARQVAAALKLDPKQPQARWWDAELHRVHGRLKEAEAAYAWFREFVNSQKEIADAETIHYVALATAQRARWTRKGNLFQLLVGDYYPATRDYEKNYWRSHLETALLFKEKYNRPQADRELTAALRINPAAAPVHAARAALALQNFDLDKAQTFIDQAKIFNPSLLAAHHAQADLYLMNFQTAEAIETLEAAQKINPRDEATLGRLAAAYGSLDGLNKPLENSRMGKLIEQATAANPHCGRFFFALAASLDDQRKYPVAAKYYEEAQKRLPQMIGPRGHLGLMYMRLGDEVKAAVLLEESFKIDPFNVRIKNQLAVLDLLKSYAVLETDHFVIRFDRGRDELLARYAAKLLEKEIYPDLVKRLGYEPKEKTLFEFFNRTKSTSGHSWFSARMVGLPYVGTVGACAGKMVALASPTSMKQKYHWGRVLKHEFVHVVNLQQTNFNIPHWYTEALAVWHEGFPRPASWDEILTRRYSEDKLFTLDTINLGFVRPKTGDDWTLAYCQSRLYAEHLLKRFGEEALIKMLDAYAENLNTSQALKKCFDVEQEDFEKTYRQSIAEIVKAYIGPASQKELTLSQLKQAVAADPKNADLLAKLAYEMIRRGETPQARSLALAAEKIQPGHQLAAYVLARVYLTIGDARKALTLLEESLNTQKPQENHLTLLAAMRLKQKKFADAERLYLLGQKHAPHPERWHKALARVYLQTGNNEKLAATLKKLSLLDSDNLTLSKKLAQLALKRQDFQAARKWANQIIYTDVEDAEAHAQLAEAETGVRNYEEAVAEYLTAIKLDGSKLAWRFALADAYVQAKEIEKARQTLKELLEIDPEYPGAAVLLEGLAG